MKFKILHSISSPVQSRRLYWVFLLAIALSATSVYCQNTFSMTIESGGITRNFRLYIPAIYSGLQPRPMVFQFHGSGSTNTTNFQNLTNFKSVADTANFILVTPQGTVFPIWNWTDWNAYETASNGVDDVRFVSDMIDTLTQLYNIDTTRIYAAGWSAGAFLGNYLGWKLSNRIAAVGSVCGGMEDSTYYKIQPPRPFSFMEIHGTLDAIVPWNGGFSQGFNLEPVDTCVQFWVKHNGCDPTPTITDLPNPNAGDFCTTKRYVWSNGDCGTEVQLLKVNGGKHTWPSWNATNSGTCKDFYADVEMWKFFRQHSLNCSSSGVIEQLPPINLSVSPNPANDVLRVVFPVEMASLELTELQITSPFGQVCSQKQLTPGESTSATSLQIQQLPAGVYLLSVRDRVGRIVGLQRFVVQR